METSLKHHFVAYDKSGTVVASRQVKRGATLEEFAMQHPDKETAEVVNNREVRALSPRD